MSSSSLGERGARDADVVVIGHKEKYLRGRTTAELDELFRAGRRRSESTTCRRTRRSSKRCEALVKQAGPETWSG